MARISAARRRELDRMLGAAASGWRGRSQSPLTGYGFRQGVPHLLLARQHEAVRALLTDFEYHLARSSASEGRAGVRPWMDDLGRAGAALADRSLAPWVHFARQTGPILETLPPWWPQHRAMVQLAAEHGDDSPVTAASEAWLAEGKCDWSWFRLVGRRPSWQNGVLARLVVDQAISNVVVVDTQRVLTVSSAGLALHDGTDGRLLGAIPWARRAPARWFTAGGALVTPAGQIVSWDPEGEVLRWREPREGCLEHVVAEFPAPAPVSGVVPVLDRWLVVLCAEGTIAVVPVEGGPPRFAVSYPVPWATVEPHRACAFGTHVFSAGDVVRAFVGHTLWELDFDAAGWREACVFTSDIAGIRCVGADVWSVHLRGATDGPRILLGHGASLAVVAIEQGREAFVQVGTDHILGWGDDAVPGVFSPVTGAFKGDLPRVHTEYVQGAMGLDEGTAITWGNDGRIEEWDLETLTSRRSYLGHKRIETMLDPLGVDSVVRVGPRHFASRGVLDHQALLFEMGCSEPVAAWCLEGEQVAGLAPHGASGAVAWSERSVAVLDSRSPEAFVGQFTEGPVRRVLSLGQRLVVVADREVVLVDATTLNPGGPRGNRRHVGLRHVRLAGPGLAVTWDNIEDPPGIWDTDTASLRARCVHPYRYHGAWEAWVAGGILATQTEISIEFWELQTGRHLATFETGRVLQLVRRDGSSIDAGAPTDGLRRPEFHPLGSGDRALVRFTRAFALLSMEPLEMMRTILCEGPRDLIVGESIWEVSKEAGQLFRWGLRSGSRATGTPLKAHELFRRRAHIGDKEGLSRRSIRVRSEDGTERDGSLDMEVLPGETLLVEGQPPVRVVPGLEPEAFGEPLGPGIELTACTLGDSSLAGARTYVAAGLKGDADCRHTLVATGPDGLCKAYGLDRDGRPLDDGVSLAGLPAPTRFGGGWLRLGDGALAYLQGENLSVWRPGVTYPVVLKGLGAAPRILHLERDSLWTVSFIWRPARISITRRWSLLDGSCLSEEEGVPPTLQRVMTEADGPRCGAWSIDGPAVVHEAGQRIFIASATGAVGSGLDASGRWVSATGSSLVIRHLMKGNRRATLDSALEQVP